MAALVIGTDIPSNINTLEELIAWGVLTGQFIFGQQQYQEINGGLLERVIDASVVRTADNKVRLIFRGAIELNPDYVTATTKLWFYALPWGDVAIPAAFKAN